MANDAINDLSGNSVTVVSSRTCILVCGLLLLPSQVFAWQSIAEKEASRITAVQFAAPTVVCVMPPNGQGGGSGVLISADGYAISNYHVTSGSGNFMKCGLNDGKLYDAVIVGIDPTGDVALIKLLGRDDFPFATPGNSDHVQAGDEVLAMGNPFLLAADFSPTVTYGIVSGVHRYQYPANTFLEYTDCIQIDASINPGNSGGPLFDINGRWIGINGRASFEKRGRINSGAAYAISVNQVLLFIGHLKSGRIADHAKTDFTVSTSSDGRVVVAEVKEVSEVWRRGLRADDELLSFAGRSLSSANDFKNVLGIYPEGVRVPLTFRNDDGIHTITTRLMPLHEFQKAPAISEEEQRPGRPEDPNPDEAEPEAPTVPNEYKHLFEERAGFTNYYFNNQLQEQFFGQLTAAIEKNGPQPDSDWAVQLAGDSDSGSKSMSLVSRRAAAGLEVDGKRYVQQATALEEENEYSRLPGLLVGVTEWHRLFRGHADDFTERVYIGSEFHLNLKRRVHTLITKHDTVISRWYFDDSSPWPVGLDVSYRAGTDDARLVFKNWTDAQSPAFPKHVGVVDPQSDIVYWMAIQSFAEAAAKAGLENGAN